MHTYMMNVISHCCVLAMLGIMLMSRSQHHVTDLTLYLWGYHDIDNTHSIAYTVMALLLALLCTALHYNALHHMIDLTLLVNDCNSIDFRQQWERYSSFLSTSLQRQYPRSAIIKLNLEVSAAELLLVHREHETSAIAAHRHAPAHQDGRVVNGLLKDVRVLMCQSKVWSRDDGHGIIRDEAVCFKLHHAQVTHHHHEEFVHHNHHHQREMHCRDQLWVFRLWLRRIVSPHCPYHRLSLSLLEEMVG